ncbi:MAG: histone deacetylase family protein [Promethearchaeota archaeon]
MVEKKIGIVTDKEFAQHHIPPAPNPLFISFETPLRIVSILKYFEKIDLFKDRRLVKLNPKVIDKSIIKLAHSEYHISKVKKMSERGGYIGEEIFIEEDTFELAKKAVGGAIQAVEKVLNKEVTHSIALIRPPGHHAVREKPSGLCLFNNIAISVYYLREKLYFNKKIAIIDIDAHFGDGTCQYFYEDPNILYISIHEFDFEEGDDGYIDELGENSAEGMNINFPVPYGLIDENFSEFIDILDPLLKEFSPEFIIVATGFDMYYDDPIGNCSLTTYSYYNFAKEIGRIADEICKGRLAFILEGGYSITGLPYCVRSLIQGLLSDDYLRPDHEFIEFFDICGQEISEMKAELIKLLGKYWNVFKK